jgi:hypothetical protein
MSKLIAIELQNFQTIEKRSRIDFKPITLLYGPNSAGKSAVFDAIELIECLWDPIKFNNSSVKEKISRWARRVEGTVGETTLAIEFEQDKDDDDVQSVWLDDKNWECSKPRTSMPTFMPMGGDTLPHIKAKNYRIKLTISIGWNKYEEAYLKKIEILAATEKIISFDEECPVLDFVDADNRGTENENAQYFTIYDPFTFGHDSNSLQEALEPPKNKSGKNQKTKLICGYLSPAQLDIRSWDDRASYKTPSPIFAQNASDIMFYFGTLLGQILRRGSPIVRADRRVPIATEALYLELRDDALLNIDRFNLSSPIRLLEPILRGQDPHFQILAASAHSNKILSIEVDKKDREEFPLLFKYFETNAAILNKINGYLSEDLFHEKLYQVSSASTLLLPVEFFQHTVGNAWMLGQAATVRLFLKDGEGREHEFDDVGSGIPFVLPVLCALAVGGIVKIQQPELHLHPALQSSLSDIFMSEANSAKDNLHIIETHSEYLALRILRRIRETTARRDNQKNLMFHPDELAIFYFDPEVVGGTHVKQIRVSDGGEFIDRWPKGFFAERASEVFDE